ncbi:MAG: hypothetical protein KIH69_003210 [Anaerolineae bacterium]|nr:hypothetical protein [Anaerolineae bacterium]
MGDKVYIDKSTTNIYINNGPEISDKPSPRKLPTNSRIEPSIKNTTFYLRLQREMQGPSQINHLIWHENNDDILFSTTKGLFLTNKDLKRFDFVQTNLNKYRFVKSMFNYVEQSVIFLTSNGFSRWDWRVPSKLEYLDDEFFLQGVKSEDIILSSSSKNNQVVFYVESNKNNSYIYFCEDKTIQGWGRHSIIATKIEIESSSSFIIHDICGNLYRGNITDNNDLHPVLQNKESIKVMCCMQHSENNIIGVSAGKFYNICENGLSLLSDKFLPKINLLQTSPNNELLVSVEEDNLKIWSIK